MRRCEFLPAPTLALGDVRYANARSLRLKIYRSLGVDIEADEAGTFNKAVIRNSRKGDVHVVNIDPKFSRFFYSNYFWSTMQG